jgi:diguanylate cyclase (GGDEF)-like protein
MPLYKIKNLERNPNILRRLMLLLGLFSIFLVVSLSGIAIYSVSKSDVLRLAEEESVRIAEVMVNQQRHFLFTEAGRSISLQPQQMDEFAQQIKRYLHPFGIVKIKIFNLERTIIYSTDHKIIGEKVEDNPRLERALRGEIDAKPETKDKVVDLANEERFNVDVVETYLPVFDDKDRIAGCFELYLDVTRYRQEIRSRVITSMSILAAILFGVFTFSYLLIHIAVRQLKNLIGRLGHLARSDPLTGTLNRGSVIERAEEELSRMKRRRSSDMTETLGVIILDLDHFKKINDTYGHLVGDEVLRELPRRVKNCLRQYDIFGRFGGEEFLALVPSSPYEGTLIVAERIRRCLNDHPFVIDELELQISASLGVSCCEDPEEGINSALRRADEALYHAKETGRNRVAGKE